jgi:hypothetical protein
MFAPTLIFHVSVVRAALTFPEKFAELVWLSPWKNRVVGLRGGRCLHRCVDGDVEMRGGRGRRRVAHENELERARERTARCVVRGVRRHRCHDRIGVAREGLLADELDRELDTAAAGSERCHQHVDVGVGAIARPVHERDLGDEEVAVAAHRLAIEVGAERLLGGVRCAGGACARRGLRTQRARSARAESERGDEQEDQSI